MAGRQAGKEGGGKEEQLAEPWPRALTAVATCVSIGRAVLLIVVTQELFARQFLSAQEGPKDCTHCP